MQKCACRSGFVCIRSLSSRSLNGREFPLRYLKGSNESTDYPIGKYKNAENAKAAFKRLVENILEKALYAIVPTDEEIESSIHQGTESSSEEEQQLKNI